MSLMPKTPDQSIDPGAVHGRIPATPLHCGTHEIVSISNCESRLSLFGELDDPTEVHRIDSAHLFPPADTSARQQPLYDPSFMMPRLTNKTMTELQRYNDCESDAESFHSAITTALPEVESRTKFNEEMGKPSSRRWEPTTKSLATNTRTKRRPRKPSSRTTPIIPTRSSSTKRTASKRSGTSANRTLSTNEYFSLDGMLALSREFTPLPSASNSSSSSHTATRHPSLIPQEGTATNSFPTSAVTEDMQRLCTKLDEKLAYTLTYSYSHTDHYESSSSPSLKNASSAASADGFAQSTACSNNLKLIPHVSHHLCPATVASHTSLFDQSFKPHRFHFNTIHTWTSNHTRRLEYDKIDRAYTGLRGLVRRVLPRWLRPKDARAGFFTGDCDGKSVRRFRMDLGPEEEPAGQHKRSDSRQASNDTKHKRRWMCFG